MDILDDNSLVSLSQYPFLENKIQIGEQGETEDNYYKLVFLKSISHLLTNFERSYLYAKKLGLSNYDMEQKFKLNRSSLRYFEKKLFLKIRRLYVMKYVDNIDLGRKTLKTMKRDYPMLFRKHKHDNRRFI